MAAQAAPQLAAVVGKQDGGQWVQRPSLMANAANAWPRAQAGAACSAPGADATEATQPQAGAACSAPGADATEVFQLSCRDAALPPGIRLSFVLKVYVILGMMLTVSMGITVPFIFATDATLAFFAKHTMLLAVVAAILIAQYVFNMCMACESCCGGSSLLRCYFSLMKTVPLNYLYLATFSGCFGIVVGFICAQYTAKSVLLVFALTFVLVMALTVYAVVTKADFTGCGAYILVMFLGFLLLIVVASFFPAEDTLRRVLAGAGAMIFGFIIVYDTQQIFGSASKAFGGGSRAIEYTIDMYAFAAWNLYLDFINFFLQMLQLLGERRN